MSVPVADRVESPEASNDAFEYRALSIGAIVSLVLALSSGLIFLAAQNSLLSAVMIAPLPLAGLVVGLASLLRIRRAPDYLSGAKLASVGAALSAACLLGGMTFAGYVYATEVPDGYVRTSFMEFAPDQVELQEGVTVPEDVLALDGEKVFIKGYIRPDSVSFERGFREFLLVRDNNECCYGDASKVKYYDQVAVKISDGLTTRYSGSMFRVGGKLHVLPNNLRRGPGYPVFKLQADYLR